VAAILLTVDDAINQSPFCELDDRMSNGIASKWQGI
jgi:hypothetical protein